jgi:hypothetical protein
MRSLGCFGDHGSILASIGSRNENIWLIFIYLGIECLKFSLFARSWAGPGVSRMLPLDAFGDVVIPIATPSRYCGCALNPVEHDFAE